MKRLILLETFRSGKVVEHELNNLLTMKTNPEATYSVVDRDSKIPLEDLIIKRRGDDLEIEVDDQIVVDLEDFYGEEVGALYSVDGSLSPSSDMALNSADALGEISEQGSAVVWPTDDGLLANPWFWGGAAVLGGGIAAAAIGSSGGGSSNNAGTTTVVEGLVTDGPVSGAALYYDVNNNGVYDADLDTPLLDENGVQVTTDENGEFSFVTSENFQTRQFVAHGGIDTVSGKPVTIDFTAPIGYEVLNPITSLIAATMESNPGMSAAEAEAAVEQALGLPDLDYSTVNLAAPDTDLAAQQAAAIVASAAITVQEDSGSSDSFAELAANMGTEGNLETLVESATDDPYLADRLRDTVNDIEQASSPDDIASSINDVFYVYHNPVITTPEGGDDVNYSQAENIMAVADVDATDEDEGQSVSYSLAGEDAALFIIDPQTGVVTFASAPDYENPADSDGDNVYNFTVIASDDAKVVLSSEQSYTITVTDQDEVAPTITSGDVVPSIDENSGAGQVIYTTTAEEPIGEGSIGNVSYSLKAVNDHAALQIDPASGEVVLTSNPNFEGQASYTFTVVATDDTGNSSEKELILDIGNLDELSPVFTSPIFTTTNENQSFLYMAVADDSADISAGVSYSLKAGVGDEAVLSIDAATGEVAILLGTQDFESKSLYSFTVIADDGINPPTEQAVTTLLSDVVEAEPLFSVLTETFSVVDSPINDETVSLDFIVLRTSSDGASSVDWQLQGIPNTDFATNLLPAGTVSFENDESFVTVSVAVPASVTREFSRDAVLVISNPSAGFAIDPDNNQATITIEDRTIAILEDSVVFTVVTDNLGVVSEGADGNTHTMEYTVTRSGDTTSALDLDYQFVASGAALFSGDDFQSGSLPADTLHFDANSGTATFSVVLSGDNLVGPDESFNLVLGGVGNPLPNGALVVGATTGTIVNDDAYVSVGLQAMADADPGEATHSFIVTRSGATDVAHTVSYTILPQGEQGATPAELDALLDMALTGEVVFAAGETEKIITVDTVDNPVIVGAQSFAMTLSSADNVTLLNDTAVSALIPNAQDVQLSATIDRALEGTAEGSALEFVYTVTRSGNIDTQAATVNWSINGGSGEFVASADDFDGGSFPSGVLEFAAGETEKEIRFTAKEDADLDGEEVFVLNLTTDQSNVRILTSAAEGIIVDDESAVGFDDSVINSIVEGDNGSSNLMVEVSRVGFSANESTVEWRLDPNDISLDDLVSGQDLLGDNGGYPSGTVTILQGEVSASITIQIAPDSSLESDENFSLSLANPSTGTKLIGIDANVDGYSNTTTATIVNDDSVLKLAEATVDYIEGNGGETDFMAITVTREGSTVGSDTVNWSLISGGDGPSADNADLGQDNSAVAEFTSYSNSWIDFASLSGAQSVAGTIELPKSGYLKVAYNRDMAFSNDSYGINQSFDQFLLDNLSVNGDATLTPLGSTNDTNYVATDVDINTIGNETAVSMSADDSGGRQVVIRSDQSLAGQNFKIVGTNADGATIEETVQGTAAGNLITSKYFTSVTSVETLGANLTVGRVNLADGGYSDYNARQDYFEAQPIDLQTGGQLVPTGDADSFDTYDRRQGAFDENQDSSFLTFTSDADLSGVSFEVTGGISLAYFDQTSGYRADYIESDPGNRMPEIDTPATVQAEQISGMLQSDDGSSDANHFMVTGLDADGNEISEIIAVPDFEVDGITNLASYTDGNMLSSAVTLDTAGRVSFSSSSDLSGIIHEISIESLMDPLTAMGRGLDVETDGDDVTQVYFSLSGGGQLQRFDGETWNDFSSAWIPIQDVIDGDVRITGMQTSFRYQFRSDNSSNIAGQVTVDQGTTFTVTGTDADGAVIQEIVNGLVKDDISVATSKLFASVTEITASNEFTLDLNIGSTLPVETSQEFAEVFGIAPVDVDGNALADNQMQGSGRIEFTMPKQFVVEGNAAGELISSEMVNYVDNIEVISQATDGFTVDIGFDSTPENTIQILTVDDFAQASAGAVSGEEIETVSFDNPNDALQFNEGTSENPSWVSHDGQNMTTVDLEAGLFRLFNPSMGVDPSSVSQVQSFLDSLSNGYELNYGDLHSDNWSDAGNDMYDGGNRLAIDGDGQSIWGEETRNLTEYTSESWGDYRFLTATSGTVLVIENFSGSSFEISGNNGADGSGERRSGQLAGSPGVYYDQIYNAGDPSINKLILTDASNPTMLTSDDTDDDYFELTGLDDATYVVYLLFAGDDGYFYDDAALTEIVSQFDFLGFQATIDLTGGETATVELALDAETDSQAGQNMLVTADGDIVSVAADISGSAEGLAYTIFKIDAPSASADDPVTLTFDVDQLGRYGVDTSSIGYSPDGTFSESVAEMRVDSSKLLIDPLTKGSNVKQLSAADLLESAAFGDDYGIDDVQTFLIIDNGNISSGQLLYNIGSASVPEWVPIADHPESLSPAPFPVYAISTAELDQGLVGFAGETLIINEGEFPAVILFNGDPDDGGDDVGHVATTNIVNASEPGDTVASGSVALEGSGYVWIRYANTDATSEGDDQAIINSMYVDNGATLSVVGQKVISDGVATDQTLGSAGELNLNGDAVGYQLPDGVDPSKLLIYFTPQEGVNRLDDVDVTLFGHDVSGNSFEITKTLETNNTTIPRDGLSVFVSLEGIEVASIDRVVYGGQTELGQFLPPVVSVVEGDLHALATDVSTPLFNSPDGSLYFDADQKEFEPGAPLVLNGSSDMGDYVNRVELGTGAQVLQGAHDLNADPTRLIISSQESLAGREITISGIDGDGNAQVETLTFGADDRVLASETLWGSITEVAAAAGDTIGRISVGQSKIFTEPNELMAYTSDDNFVSFTVHGLDADGQPVSYQVENLKEYIAQDLGAMSEIFGVEFESTGNLDLYYKPVSEGFIDAWSEIPLNNVVADENGAVTFDAAQRIVIQPVNSGVMRSFRVTGTDAEGREIVEIIEGANPYGNGSTEAVAITENYFTTLTSVEASVWHKSGNEEQLISYIGTIGEPVIADQLAEVDGSEVQLGTPIAEFDTPSSLSFTSSEDLSDRVFTITGTLADGSVVTEEVTGPNAGLTLSSQAFMTVSSISVDDGAEGSIKVGYVTTQGGLTDNFVVTGSGTAADPFVGHSTNTLESSIQYANDDAVEASSEADVLLYVDFSGAEGPVSLYYDLAVQGASGEDVLYVEYSSDILSLLQGSTSFADGESETTILIPVAGDDTREADESMTLTLTGSSTGTTIDATQNETEITILNDDDTVTLTTTENSGAEGNSDVGVLEFTATRENSGPAKTITWEIILSGEEGAATADDFTALTGTAIFVEGATTAIIQVGLAADRTYESDESFQLQLTTAAGSGYTLAGNTVATAVIINDDVGISIVADAASQAEGDSGIVAHTFTVTRVGDLSQSSEVDWMVSGTDAGGAALAAEAVDFDGDVLPSDSLTFAAGATGSQNTETQQITINSNGDTALLGDRGFTVTLTNAEGDSSEISTASAAGLIVEDEAIEISFDVGELAQNEGTDAGVASTFTYTLTRTGDTSRALTLDWNALAQGGAAQVNTDDFAAGELPAGQVTFAAGSATASISFDVNADAIVERDESMILRLDSSTSTVVAQDQLVTIMGDDDGFAVELEDKILAEGNEDRDVTITFIRLGGATDAIDYTWEVQGQTSDDVVVADNDDFSGGILPSGSVSFVAGESIATATISLSGDSDYELNDGFIVKLIDTNGTDVLAASELTTIVNDDAQVGVAVDTGSFTEGSVVDGYETLTYTFSREGNLDQESTIDWALAANDGVTALDFVAILDQDGVEQAIDGLPTGTVTFATGAATHTIQLQIARDSLAEVDESISLQLSSPSVGTSITTGSDLATTTVLDDDAQVQFSDATMTQSAAEGSPVAVDVMSDASFSEMTFTVERGGTTTGTSSVGWRLVYDGEATSADFTGATSGTLNFVADATSADITVQVLKDHYGEGDESFSVELYDPATGTSIGPNSTAEGTISGDDESLYLADDQTVIVKQAEGREDVNSNDTVTTYSWELVRTGDLTQALSVDYQVEAAPVNSVYDYSLADYGTDWSGDVPSVDSSDFVGGSYPMGTVTFAEGENTATISIDVVGDNTVETSEAFRIAVSRPAGVIDFSINGNPLVEDTQYLTGIIARDEGLVRIGNELVVADGDVVGLDNAKSEGDAGEVVHYFEITRELSDVGDMTVDWKVSSNSTWQNDVSPYLSHVTSSSADTDDFVGGQDVLGNGGFPSGTATILDGETSTIIEIRTSGDLTAEDIESFKVQLENVQSGNSIVSPVSYGYIGIDDPLFSVGMLLPEDGNDLSFGSKIVEEGDTVTYRIYRSGDTSGEATVDWDVTYPAMVEAGNEASSYGYEADVSDFADGETLSGTLTFADGVAYQDISLQTKADGVSESWAEGFDITLSNASGDATISNNAGSMESLIIDSDAPTSLVSVESSVTNGGVEGTTGDVTDTIITYTLTRSGDTTSAGQIAWTLETPGSDILSIIGDTGAQHPLNGYWSGLVTFEAGQDTKTITVNVTPDTTVESDEDFVFTLVDAKSILENPGTSYTPSSWNYGDDGSADVGIDNGLYLADSERYGGEVPDSGSMLRDPDAFQTTTQIVNDDVRIRIDQVNMVDSPTAEVYEGDTGTTDFDLSLTRFGELTSEITLGYDVVAGTADGTDVVVSSGTLTLEAGSSSYTETLSIITADMVVEADEVFTLRLSSGDVNVSFAQQSHYAGSASVDLPITILNDDTSWSVTSAMADQSEGDSGNTSYTFTIVRPNDGSSYNGAATVDWQITHGDTDTVDFTGALSGTVSFAENEFTKDVTIQTVGDLEGELNEAFDFTLVGANHGQISVGSGSVAATIINDDQSISIGDATVIEGDSGSTAIEFTVTRIGDLTGTASADWTVVHDQGDETTNVTDFADGETLSGLVEFAAEAGNTSGTQTQTITLDVKGDVVAEADETFNVNLSALSTGLTALDLTAVGTIENDETLFTLTAGDNVVEGDVAGQLFTLTRENTTTQDQTIDWAVSSDGGSHGAVTDDLVGAAFPSGSVTFTGAELEQTFFVKSSADGIAELDESFIVTLTAGAGVTAEMLIDDTAYGAILNDDGVVDPATITPDSTVAIAGDVSGTEGDDGTQYVEFTINRTGIISYEGTVDWSVSLTSSGDDADLADFGGSLPSGTLTLPAGEGAITLQVPVNGDSLLEVDETFELTLSGPSVGLELAVADSAIGTITNDDDQMSIADSSTLLEATEGTDTSISFTVERSGSLTGESTVEWRIVSPEGNATNGDDDFATYSGVVTFVDADDSETVTVNIQDDAISEADEPFTIELVNPGSGSTIDDTDDSREVSIINDDQDVFTVTTDEGDLLEGDSADGYKPYTFTVSRQNPTTTAEVDWSASGSGDNPLDIGSLESSSGTVTFAVGELETTITVNVSMDIVGDYDRTFDVILANPVTSDPLGASLGTASTTAIVANDDPALQVQLLEDVFVEGSGEEDLLVQFNVIRTGDLSGTASVDWELQSHGDDPVDFSDFNGFWPVGSVSFAANESEKLVQVQIAADSYFEADEGFLVELSNAVGADIIGAIDNGMIGNDDNGVFVEAVHSSLVEGDSGTIMAEFTLSVEGVAGESVTVDYVIEGTGSAPANVSDFDSGYGSNSVTLIIGGDGTASTTVTAAVQGDTLDGNDETFRLRVTDVVNGVAVDDQALVTIANDDSLVSISQTPIVLTEGDADTTTFSFTVSRTGDLTRAAVVDYEVLGQGDNAASAGDFIGNILASDTITFAVGIDTMTIDVEVAGDTVFESDEDFVVQLSSGTPTGGESIAAINPAASQALATINNDDLADLQVAGLSTTVYEGTESPGFLTYVITRNGDNSAALDVSYSLIADDDNGGVATLPDASDVVGGLSGTITLAAGESSTLLTLQLVANADFDATRNFLLQATADGYADPAAVASAILDDDSGVSVAFTSSEPIVDATRFIFTVSRTGETLPAIDVDWEVSGVSVNPVDAADFGGVLPSDTLSFAEGESSLTITIDVPVETSIENDEAFRLSLTSSSEVTQPILTADADAVVVCNNEITEDSDVINGGMGTDVIEALGGDDVIHAGGGADVVYAGAGDDQIFAEGGADAIYGGVGNDSVTINEDNVVSFDESPQTFIDGGLGVDKLILDGADLTLDLTQLMADDALFGIDIIDLTGTGANILNLNVTALESQDAQDMFDGAAAGVGVHQLMIDGDVDDAVLVSDIDNWTQAADTFDYDGNSYNVYDHDNGTEQLLINIEIVQVTDEII